MNFSFCPSLPKISLLTRRKSLQLNEGGKFNLDMSPNWWSEIDNSHKGEGTRNSLHRWLASRYTEVTSANWLQGWLATLEMLCEASVILIISSYLVFEWNNFFYQIRHWGNMIRIIRLNGYVRIINLPISDKARSTVAGQYRVICYMMRVQSLEKRDTLGKTLGKTIKTHCMKSHSGATWQSMRPGPGLPRIWFDVDSEHQRSGW